MGIAILIMMIPVNQGKIFFMKKIFYLLPLLFMVHANEIVGQEINVSIGYQSFYSELAPYGEWISYPGYGYVWRYRFSRYAGFRPYCTRGRWVYTDAGWTWVSSYPWGWAAFHYGRWFYDEELGWLWIPGDQWAPAWVTWGSYEDNFCWAPLEPNVSISVIAAFRPPPNYWVVCPGIYFGRAGWSAHVENTGHNLTMVRNISVIGNSGVGHAHAYLRGPAPAAVERFTRMPVRPVTISENRSPGSDRVVGNRLALYRPSIRRNDPGSGKPVSQRLAGPAKPYPVTRAGAARAAGGHEPHHAAGPEYSAPKPATKPAPGPVRQRPAQAVRGREIQRPFAPAENPSHHPGGRPAPHSPNSASQHLSRSGRPQEARTANERKK